MDLTRNYEMKRLIAATVAVLIVSGVAVGGDVVIVTTEESPMVSDALNSREGGKLFSPRGGKSPAPLAQWIAIDGDIYFCVTEPPIMKDQMKPVCKKAKMID
jgi:hypothetical protein